jgi:hypothetical protein
MDAAFALTPSRTNLQERMSAIDRENDPCKNRSTAGPEKESSQNRVGGDSEGKAPLRKFEV